MKSVISTINRKFNSALWLSDLHLDKASDQQTKHLLEQVSATAADCCFITGDISKARSLTEHLRLLAAACGARPIFFVTGNHDYYGSSFAHVDTAIRNLGTEVRNLHFLKGQQIIPLNRHACLIGDRGWPDARTGYGIHSLLRSPDHSAIHDFRGLTRQQSMIRMQELGRESASRIRKVLPLALTRFRHVILLTHTPPFPEAVRFNDAPCGPLHLPHYTNLSAGITIRGIAKAFPSSRITILAGHSHSSSITHIGTNICVRVAHARTGRTGPLELLRLS